MNTFYGSTDNSFREICKHLIYSARSQGPRTKS